MDVVPVAGDADVVAAVLDIFVLVVPQVLGFYFSSIFPTKSEEKTC